MKILVTGATGFLGSFLCPILQNQGHCLVQTDSKTCNLLKENSLHIYNSERFDWIFHLAAWTQAGDFCLHHPGEQWIINQKINTHMLSWWNDFQPQAKMICIGTSCAYDPAFALEEENYLSGLPIDSLLTYAMTKRMLYCGLQALHKQYGRSYLYVIPSTLYGPSYHTDGRQMHFIFDLIHKFLRGVRQGNPVILWGDGQQKRELIHVRDFVAALIALTKSCENTLINVGGGKEYSIKDFAKTIADHVGFPMEKVQFDTSKYVGARSKVLSIKKLRRLLPDFHHTSLEQGLVETIEWFEKQFF